MQGIKNWERERERGRSKTVAAMKSTVGSRLSAKRKPDTARVASSRLPFPAARALCECVCVCFSVTQLNQLKEIVRDRAGQACLNGSPHNPLIMPRPSSTSPKKKGKTFLMLFIAKRLQSQWLNYLWQLLNAAAAAAAEAEAKPKLLYFCALCSVAIKPSQAKSSRAKNSLTRVGPTPPPVWLPTPVLANAVDSEQRQRQLQ